MTSSTATRWRPRVPQKEAENVHKLIKAARDSANSGEAAVKPYVDKLDAVARNWDKVAQPIQLSAKARGIDHEPSRALAYEIRSLAIDLFNKHDMLDAVAATDRVDSGAVFVKYRKCRIESRKTRMRSRTFS